MLRLLLIATLVFIANPAMALKSDRDQPATVEADEVEYDFRTGERTYTGNVVVVQGTMRITGDKLVVEYNGDQLEKATVWGRPATYKQRPDGKDHDVIGKGRTMVLNQITNKVILTTDASLRQGPDLAEGDEIIYNIETEKLSIKTASTSTGSTDSDKQETEEEEKPSRVKVIITPTGSSTDPAQPAAE